MESIEERATIYSKNLIDTEYDRGSIIEAFIDGAKSEHTELTKWHDVSEMPNHNNEIICKLRYGGYDIVRKSFDSDIFIDCREENYDRTSDIIGWREIHE